MKFYNVIINFYQRDDAIKFFFIKFIDELSSRFIEKNYFLQMLRSVRRDY